MNTRTARALSALAALALSTSLTGCGLLGDEGGPGSGRVQVAAGFYALGYVAERVGGDHVDVTTLTQPGQDPHDVELSVARTAEVAEADLVLHLSGFQPVVDDAVGQVAEGVVVDTADAADLVATSSEHEHEDEGEGEGEKPREDEDGEADPHFWLDPQRLSAVAGPVTEALAEADPDNADDYRANLRALEDDLASLDEDLEQGLADCERDVVVASHDAFGYWAQRYGLDLHSIAGLSPDAEPSVQHLRELQELIETEDVTTVFSERLASAQLADTLSSDLDLRTAVLDPIEGLSDETADEDYVSLMRQNLEELREANGCR